MAEAAGCADTEGLVGRRRERALLERALDDARAGAGGSVTVLRGEAGIGKTALLDWAADRADRAGYAVVRAAGAEAEVAVAFGALHQVLRPLLESARDALPPYQRQALESALGLRDAIPPGGFAVGAAALALLTDAARRRPLLIVVDDLHWVDSSSAAVFAFLHRRIDDLPVVLVVATRAEGSAPEGWHVHPVDVEPLPDADADAVLRRWHPDLTAVVAERVRREAAGNPLALTELPRQLRAEHRSGVVPLPERLPWGRRLERLFASRLRALSPEALRALLPVALGGDGDGGTWWSSVGDRHGDRAERLLDDVEASGLARLDHTGRLVFRHPLVRSAVIALAPEADRRAAHRLLAARLPEDEPRGLLHEAQAVRGPDEELAARLQEAGTRIALRGGDAEAALLLDRAAGLSPDADDRTRRLAWAAVMSARGGRLAYAARLVEQLRTRSLPDDVAPVFAYAVVYVDQSHHVDFASSFTLLPRALAALTAPGAPDVPGRGDLVEQVFFKLLLASSYTGDARGWRALARHLGDVSPAARLCHRVWADPPRTAHGTGRELRAAAEGAAGDGAGHAWLLLWAALGVDGTDAGPGLLLGGQHAYATQGSVAKVRCRQDFLLGRWDAADDWLREADSAEELGYHCNALLFRHYYAHVLAGRGDGPGFDELRARVEPAARAAGMRFVTDHLGRLRALVDLAHGRDEEAYERLCALLPPGRLPSGLSWFHLPFFDLVQAAVRSGHHAAARAHVAAGRAARMEEISDHHAFLLAAAAALTAGEDEQDEAFAAAYALAGTGPWVFALARLRLEHGARLRLGGRRAEAEDVLHMARHAFRELGAGPWADQCCRELRAAGLSAEVPAARVELLTAQELRVARLVAAGLTNKQIGAELNLSPRSVASHLYKIFPKLGIASRAALGRALAER
ncbi:LuxR family transcriptional regulator [Streptomyces longispororuber]|uniref:LuxR family transcriptional regulator n=1 Tax=Streptomyces longispororuber TaxID=68230 RepID=A0A918ZL61_9ACTN|nr:LuxR family transcriptional regulator [Streptomyces longispororuber]GHE58911.1 LuxR family transcriptional regulator [Streptomyces longispororuber]